MAGINLHAIVNPVIATLHPNHSATLYRSTGQKNVKGVMQATYAEGESISCQIQSESAETLAHVNMVGQEEVSRRIYLFSTPGMSDRVASIVRPIARNGDFLQIDTADPWYGGQWYLVHAIIEDFTVAGSGWSNVRATLQVKGPDFSHSSWFTV